MLQSKLKVLKVIFDAEIKPYEIPAFRGAVAAKAGHKHILFHNHLGDGFRYSYPLIQYKTLGRKPTIVCLGEGVDNIHHYFEKRDWSIHVSDRKIDMKIGRLDMNQFTMQVWDKQFHYYIHNWVALNSKNWKAYQQIESVVERIKYLEKKLIAHIISFAKGIDWNVSKTIELTITQMKDPNPVKIKGVSMVGFCLEFQCNVFLPNHIGLGKGVSLGFGTLRSAKKKSAAHNTKR